MAALGFLAYPPPVLFLFGRDQDPSAVSTIDIQTLANLELEHHQLHISLSQFLDIFLPALLDRIVSPTQSTTACQRRLTCARSPATDTNRCPTALTCDPRCTLRYSSLWYGQAPGAVAQSRRSGGPEVRGSALADARKRPPHQYRAGDGAVSTTA